MENSQCGQTVQATKNGKRYLLKRYQTPIQPIKNGALDERTFIVIEKQFTKFVNHRKKINELLRTVWNSIDNAPIPYEEFIFDHHFIEAYAFIDNVVASEATREAVLGLTMEQKKLVMLTAVSGLVALHRVGIIHGDISLNNIVVSKNQAGEYIAQLIDFDCSYHKDDKPVDFESDISYYSPELGLYCTLEDEEESVRAKYREAITDKSDIFSLGLVFHYYLAGQFPDAKSLTKKLAERKEKGKTIYCWAVLNNGCELKISDNISNNMLSTLIREMISVNPKNRPTANEVLRRLQEIN